MADLKQESRALIAAAVNLLKNTKNADSPDISAESVTAEVPPNPEMGDIGFPMFPFARVLRIAPPIIAQEVAKLLNEDASLKEKAAKTGTFAAVGPYVNVKLEKGDIVRTTLEAVLAQKQSYGAFDETGKKPLDGRRVMIEFSSPNTNKPLHLGHLRNDALGESVSRILKAAGAEVYKVNIINNRGVHICKSMLAYKLFHEANGETPEKVGMKGDHFVGQCYVEFNKYYEGEKDKPETAHPEAAQMAEDMLVKWEAGDKDVHKLWKTMNDWTVNGIMQTYERTDVSFDKFYYESETYLKGKELILDGLERGIFYKAEDGSVRVDVSEVVGKNKEGEDQQKVLLRKDGTSVYITQDIGTAVSRHDDWSFNQLVYVVGNEQNYHFKVLFYILKKLGFDWANQLFHLSYGMVNLPEGKMKSREGTVVDADDLINQLRDGALEEIAAKGREEAVGKPEEVAEKIALGALHYFLLQATPAKDMMFNPKESLSFNGNTGPYLQYMGARICSILRKAEEAGVKLSESVDFSLLNHPAEWALVKALGEYPATLKKAAEKLDPSEIAALLYEVAKLFSSFYHDCPILGIDNHALTAARLALVRCVKTVLENGMNLILVPFLETM
ncbi:MAG: arginine--tRNA ligase [Spirochaetales bacterium]|nr:arginine--tRNA ligase [Spirochaetales bacterium]